MYLIKLASGDLIIAYSLCLYAHRKALFLLCSCWIFYLAEDKTCDYKVNWKYVIVKIERKLERKEGGRREGSDTIMCLKLYMKCIKTILFISVFSKWKKEKWYKLLKVPCWVLVFSPCDSCHSLTFTPFLLEFLFGNPSSLSPDFPCACKSSLLLLWSLKFTSVYTMACFSKYLSVNFLSK